MLQTAMHKAIIAILKFPRVQISQNLRVDAELGDCRHAGYFNPDDEHCTLCEAGGECLWVYQNEEESVLQQRSLQELGRALEFAIAYVDSKVSRAGHNFKNCRCELCDWLRDANRLFVQLVEKTDGNKTLLPSFGSRQSS